VSEIIFTKHALRKLKQRGISRSTVIRAVFSPEKLILDGGKYLSYRRFGRLYLKVIFKRMGRSIIIITQHFVEKIK